MQPKMIKELSSIEAISSGEYHSVALSANGGVYSWGRSLFGATGMNPIVGDMGTPRFLPMQGKQVI